MDMEVPISRIKAKNFRSLADVDAEFGRLTVLVGPNGSGKTNLLNVLRFLAATARFDLEQAIDDWGGYDRVRRQSPGLEGGVTLEVHGHVTQNARGSAPDEYKLSFNRTTTSLRRTESFRFKRAQGRGRRLTVSGRTVKFFDEEAGATTQTEARDLASTQTTGLAALPRLGDASGGEGIRAFTEFLTDLRVLEPDIAAARLPSRDMGGRLADDASNLADALVHLRASDPDAWGALLRDLALCLPGLAGIDLAPIGGAARRVEVQLVERGLSSPVPLADASFGTVRLLTLLAALHNPRPPRLLAIEEIDHGLHPYALDVLVDRIRAASQRTQIIAATHSPTLVNRLEADEILVCDRDPQTGASQIPAISAEAIRSALAASEYGAGELWFAGVIRGVPA